MFQPAGAGVVLDLSWRENIPFLRSPSCPRPPARFGVQAKRRGGGVMLEVKLASQERRLPVSTVTSGEGAQSSPCTLIPLIRLTSRPPQRASPHCGRSMRSVFLPATILQIFLSPSHLSTPRGPVDTPRLQPTLSFHFPLRLTSRKLCFLPTT